VWIVDNFVGSGCCVGEGMWQRLDFGTASQTKVGHGSDSFLACSLAPKCSAAQINKFHPSRRCSDLGDRVHVQNTHI
jgi:hypothetical protein